MGFQERLSPGVWASYHGFHTTPLVVSIIMIKIKNIPKVWTLLDWIVYSESACAIVWTLHICISNYLAEFKVLFCFYSLVHVFLFCFELIICPCRRIWNLLPGPDLRWLCLVCTWFSEVLDACIPGLLWLVSPGYFRMLQ